jgi:subtilase family serine protease
MSWGWPSAQMCAQENGPAQCQTMTSQQYSTRVDTEFMKISARGVTNVGASGDQGAPGDTYYTCSPGLSDIMPGSSTWVTGVGATQLGNPSAPAAASAAAKRGNPWGAPVCSSVECADGSLKYEIVSSSQTGSLITSGGGFQSYFPQPAWQKQAVSHYLKTAPPLPVGYFNARFVLIALPLVRVRGLFNLDRKEGVE